VTRPATRERGRAFTDFQGWRFRCESGGQMVAFLLPGPPWTTCVGNFGLDTRA